MKKEKILFTKAFSLWVIIFSREWQTPFPFFIVFHLFGTLFLSLVINIVNLRYKLLYRHFMPAELSNYSLFKEKAKINRLFIRKYLLRSIYKDNFVAIQTKTNYEKRKNIIYQSPLLWVIVFFPGVANAIPGFLSFICLGCCFFPSLLIRKSPLQAVLSPFHACGTPYISPFKERTKINRFFLSNIFAKINL